MTTLNQMTLRILAPPIDWDTTYWELMPRVFNFFSYRFGGDKILAEELTAITFEKAWSKRNRYRRNLSKFSTWVFTIARNTATDYLRQQGRRPVVDLQEELMDSAENEPDHILQQKQTHQRLQQLLVQLPDRDRDIIALKYGSQMTNREIAHHMKLSESNIGSILHRTIRTMRQEWETHHE